MMSRTANRGVLFPSILASLAFLAFLAVYWLLTAKSVEPQYILGLLFLIPCFSFAAVAVAAKKGFLRHRYATGMTLAMVPVFMLASIALLFTFSIGMATTTVTDVAKYERVLRLNGYPERPLLAHFPALLPENARVVSFYYTPQFMMGGETYALRFATEHDQAAHNCTGV